MRFYRTVQKISKKITLLILAVGLVGSYSFPLQAQNQSSTQAGPRKQLSGIFLTGMAGAVLGLSTLSFYGRPQDKLGNIAIGFALGAVIGTVMTTYDTATQPQKYYGDLEDLSTPELNKISTHKKSIQIPLFAYHYEF